MQVVIPQKSPSGAAYIHVNTAHNVVALIANDIGHCDFHIMLCKPPNNPAIINRSIGGHVQKKRKSVSLRNSIICSRSRAKVRVVSLARKGNGEIFGDIVNG